jgi:hypothetical protein
MTPKTKHVSQGKMYLSKSKITLKQLTSAKKKYFTINFIHLTHTACQILSTFTRQCHCFHLHKQCLHHPHTHSLHPHPLPSHSTTYHCLIHCIGCTAFLKTLECHFLWAALPYRHDPHWLKKYIYISRLISLLESMKIHNFFSEMVLVLLRILNTHVLDFVVVSRVWSVCVDGSFNGFLFVDWSFFFFFFGSCS